MREMFDAVLAILSLALLVLFLLGDAQADEMTRIHGQKAVMNVYFIDPKTLDIVAVQNYGYPTMQQCAANKAAASKIAQDADPTDAIIIKCVSAIVVDDKPAPAGTQI